MRQFAIAFAVMTLPLGAWASPECALIENNIYRLSCYEDLYRGVSRNDGNSVISAFVRFSALVEYEGDEGWRQV